MVAIDPKNGVYSCENCGAHFSLIGMPMEAMDATWKCSKCGGVLTEASFKPREHLIETHEWLRKWHEKVRFAGRAYPKGYEHIRESDLDELQAALFRDEAKIIKSFRKEAA